MAAAAAAECRAGDTPARHAHVEVQARGRRRRALEADAAAHSHTCYSFTERNSAPHTLRRTRRRVANNPPATHLKLRKRSRPACLLPRAVLRLRLVRHWLAAL
jgi:hypothetical protein